MVWACAPGPSLLGLLGPLGLLGLLGPLGLLGRIVPDLVIESETCASPPSRTNEEHLLVGGRRWHGWGHWVAAGSVGVCSSQSGRLRKLGMKWAVVADSETCTSECMSDQLATLGRNRETDQLAGPLSQLDFANWVSPDNHIKCMITGPLGMPSVGEMHGQA